MKAHIIEGGKIINTIIVDELGPNMIDASVGGGIGGTWDGVKVVMPPSTVPAVVTNPAVIKMEIDMNSIPLIRDWIVSRSKEPERLKDIEEKLTELDTKYSLLK